MALNIGDRVLETTQTQGTGTVNLAGPTAGFRSFVAGVGNGKKTVYLISDTSNWEIGIGTVTSGTPSTLSRTTILKSSNSNAAVSWGPGTRNVYCVMAADVLASTDENLNLVNFFGAGGGTANAHTITLDKTPLAYSNGMMVAYRATIANTTVGMTVNVNGLGAKALKVNGVDPAAGQIAIGTLVVAFYNQTINAFETINSPGVANLPLSGGNMTGGINEKISTVASSATPDIWTGTGNVIDFTGTATVTGFAAAPQAGTRRTLICAGACTFTNSANMIINGAANFTAAAGDLVSVIAVTTTQFRLAPVRVSGQPLVANNNIGLAYFAAERSGSTNVTAGNDVVYDTVINNQGGNYNNGNGKYTADANSLVQFFFMASAQNTSAIQLQKNGVMVDQIYTYTNGAAQGKVVNLPLLTGDTVWVRCTAGTVWGTGSITGKANGFSGVRLT